MSISLHARLLQRPLLLFGFLIIATILLKQTNDQITSTTEIYPVQFASIERPAIPHPIDQNDFHAKLEQLTAKIDKSTFHRFFYLDFGWALLLLCNIYVFTCKARGTKQPIRWLVVILSLAYGFDVLENVTYLTELPLLIRYLEYTNQAKLLFYGLGIGSLLYFTGKWLMQKFK